MSDLPTLTPEEQQEKWLAEAQKMVRQHAYSMKNASHGRNLSEVLKHGALMLAELRTSNLSPQNYYELYSMVQDEMQHLESYFYEEVTLHGRKVEDLYEIVQHAGNIVPRLYLLITVGSVYIKTKEAPAKDILKDLVEMCKGVQHPTRGLFLRHYLSTVTKNKLPDIGNAYEGEGGSVADSVDFVLQNFKEMVWLWVRMEKKQIIADPTRRDKERQTLRQLVGFNLTRIGNLEISLQMYVDIVMPKILEVIEHSTDVIAQQYLTEVLIQVFPDEFHLAKIDDLLKMFCTQLMSGVNVQEILTSLMDRLGKYAVEVKESNERKKKWERNALATMFDSFRNAISEQKPNVMSDTDYISTQLSLLKLVLQAYPDQVDRVNELFATTAKFLEGKELDSKTVGLIRQMLTRPLNHYGSMTAILDFDDWPSLLALLDTRPRREVSRELCEAALLSSQPVETVEHVSKVFEFIKPLISSEEGALDDDEVEEDQILVAKMIHLFKSESLSTQFKMYSAARKQFGRDEKRMRYTLFPLVFCFLRLALKVKKAIDNEEEVGKVSVERILTYVAQTLEVLSGQDSKQSLSTYLQASRTADKCEQPDMCNDMLDRAFQLYEEDVCSDSKVQIQLLPSMISSVASLRRLDEDRLEKFNTKLCSYSTKLLKKPDQARAACSCAALFMRSKNEEQQARVAECLQKAQRFISNVSDAQATPIFVDILNRYLYFFAKTNLIEVKPINVLWKIVSKKIVDCADFEDVTGVAAPDVHYANTVDYVRERQADGDETAEWSQIDARSLEA